MFQITRAMCLVAMVSAVSACSTPQEEASLTVFQTHLQSLCGKAVKGQVTSTDQQDEDWRKEVLTLGPVTCPNALTTVLPLAVGSDKSRVWTLELQDGGQRLDFRHAHSLKDGSPDPVTGYGGVATAENSTATHAVFPIDEISKAIFAENDLQASLTNTWSITIAPGNKMEYKLSREGRNFVAEFDLTLGK